MFLFFLFASISDELHSENNMILCYWTNQQVWAGLEGLQDSRDAEGLKASDTPPLQVSRVEAVQLLQVWHLLQEDQKAAVCET